MPTRSFTVIGASIAVVAAAITGESLQPSSISTVGPLSRTQTESGKSIFRFDTYGDETFWTDTLRMHEVIRTSVSPKTALSVGLKVDADALPAAVKAGIKNGTLNLE